MGKIAMPQHNVNSRLYMVNAELILHWCGHCYPCCAVKSNLDQQKGNAAFILALFDLTFQRLYLSVIPKTLAFFFNENCFIIRNMYNRQHEKNNLA